MAYALKLMHSPVGQLKLIAGEKGLTAILWQDEGFERVKIAQVERDDQHPVLLETERQLKEYFEGKRRAFDIELDFIGTDFQLRVWNALLYHSFWRNPHIS